MKFDGWEHYYLTDEGKAFLNKISKDLNLDYAVIEWPSKENACAVHLYTQSAYGSIPTTLSSSWTTEVFDLKTLKSVGITYLGSDHGTLRDTTPPKSAKKITPEELTIYTKDSAKAPRGAMLQFFE